MPKQADRRDRAAQLARGRRIGGALREELDSDELARWITRLPEFLDALRGAVDADAR